MKRSLASCSRHLRRRVCSIISACALGTFLSASADAQSGGPDKGRVGQSLSNLRDRVEAAFAKVIDETNAGPFLEMGPRYAREWPVFKFVSVFAEIGTGVINHPQDSLKGTKWEGMNQRISNFSMPQKIEDLASFHLEAGIKTWLGAEFGGGVLLADLRDPLPYAFGEFGYILPHYGNDMLQGLLHRTRISALTTGGAAARATGVAGSAASTGMAAGALGPLGALLSGWTSFVRLVNAFRPVMRYAVVTMEGGFALVYYFKD